MSRLADILARMDRGAGRPVGVGRIAGLGAAPERSWHRGALFAMVVSMLVVSAAAAFQLVRVARPGPPVALPSPPSAAVPAPAAPLSRATDERFDTLLGRGLEKARQDALPAAAELLTEALTLRPTDAETWNSLGVVLVRQGQTARGTDAFNRALCLSPDHAEAHRNLAVALDRQGRSDSAAAHYRAFLRASREDHPSRDDVRRRLDQISSAAGQLGGMSESR